MFRVLNIFVTIYIPNESSFLYTCTLENGVFLQVPELEIGEDLEMR